MTFITKQDDIFHFDYSLHSTSNELDSLVIDLSKELKLYFSKQKDAFRLILLNLAQANGLWVAVSMDNNHVVDARYKHFDVGIRTIRTTIHKLVDANLLLLTDGKNLPYENGIRTTIFPTPHLSKLIKNIAPCTVSKELVLLRNGDENKGQASLIGYTDTNRSNRIRKELQAYNDLLNSVDVLLLDQSGKTVVQDLNGRIISRKFIDNGEVDTHGNPLFNSGGRSYSDWCSLNESNQRPFITIDGEPTIEEDFTASSINIIYRVLTGKVYKGDPYQLIVGKRQVPRHLVKAVSSCAQNNLTASSVSGAVGGRYSKIKDSTDPLKLQQHREYMVFKNNVKVEQVLNGFLEKHKAISCLLMKGKEVGNKIQCLESDLVFSIVNELTQQGIPCLTIHDSFIVKKKDLQTLKNLMDTTDFPDSSLVSGLV